MEGHLPLRWGRMDWEGEPEGCPLSWDALDTYLSFLSVDELLANVETEAQARLPPVLDGGLVDLIVPLPDVCLLLLREARPPILYPDPNCFSF